MTERLADLVLGLQRMAENVRMRGDDLRHLQQQETYDHIQWLDHQLAMVEKVRAVFLEERKRFMPVERERVHQLSQEDKAPERMPRVVQKASG